jgi:hypothetical protein
MMHSANDTTGIIRYAHVGLAGWENNSSCWVPVWTVLGSHYSIDCRCSYILVRVDVLDNEEASRRE